MAEHSAKLASMWDVMRRAKASAASHQSSATRIWQVVDDILDITQSTEVLGKTAGKDLLSDKATYPSLLGLERSRQVCLPPRQ